MVVDEAAAAQRARAAGVKLERGVAGDFLVGARVVRAGKPLWAAYDCGKNAWLGIELDGADPIGKGPSVNVFNNSMGLMYDPNRKLVWAVGQNSHVHVLRLDLKSARVHELR